MVRRFVFAVILLIAALGLPALMSSFTDGDLLPDIATIDAERVGESETRVIEISKDAEPVTLITEALVLDGQESTHHKVLIRLILNAPEWVSHACRAQPQILDQVRHHLTEHPNHMPDSVNYRTRPGRALRQNLNGSLAGDAIRDIDFYHYRAEAKRRTDKVYLCANGKVTIIYA